MTLKVAVIGSGPVALTCIEELFNAGLVPDLYMPTENFSSAKDALLSPLLLKDRFTKPHLYTCDLELEPLFQKRTAAYEINRIGGLSEIWGGVFLPNHSLEQCYADLSRDEASLLAREILDKRKYNGSLSLINEYLNLDGKSEINSLDVPIFYENQTSQIWSAREELVKIKSLPYILANGPAIKLIADPKNNKTQIVYAKSRTETETSLDYDWVFVAAGPIGDARLILETMMDLDSVEINDTNVIYTIRLGRHPAKNFVNLIPFRIRANFSSKIPGYSQEYVFSKQMISALKYKVFHPIIDCATRIFRKWVTVEMNFLPQSKSSPMQLNRQGNLFTVESKKLFPLLFVKPQLKMFPFSLRIGIGLRAMVGAGQHSGSFVTNEKSGARLNSVADLHIPRTTFLGASSLTILPTGPITLTSMINALSLTRRTLEKIR